MWSVQSALFGGWGMLMHKIVWIITIVTGVFMMEGLVSDLYAEERVRLAAVAGSFYDKNPSLLREVLLRYLAESKALPEPVRLMISPHAGYVFSGPVAAKGYANLDSKVKRVIILGPSHYKVFPGVAVPTYDFYETPLGRVPIDRSMVDRLKRSRFVIEADKFDEPEHCLEVQLPFLQIKLQDFTIVPILCGKVDPAEVAQLLLPLIDEKTAVIVSSDLSHYEHQQSAKETDKNSITTVLAGNVTGNIDACGEVPIRVIMHLAQHLALKPVLVDARTSFDTAPQHCPESNVVGYASIAYLSKKAAEAIEKQANDSVSTNSSMQNEFPPALQQVLLGIARNSLDASVRGEKTLVPDSLPPLIMALRGCFVTLTVKGRLRGCIGYIEPIKPLYEAVIDNAKNAALNDPRFPKVKPEELQTITIEVSVLTEPKPLEYKNSAELLAKIEQGHDGVILSDGVHQSTYLPQVWEQLPDKVQFLEQLSLKAGMAKNSWKSAEVKTYRAIHFSE